MPEVAASKKLKAMQEVMDADGQYFAHFPVWKLVYDSTAKERKQAVAKETAMQAVAAAAVAAAAVTAASPGSSATASQKPSSSEEAKDDAKMKTRLFAKIADVIAGKLHAMVFDVCGTALAQAQQAMTEPAQQHVKTVLNALTAVVLSVRYHSTNPELLMHLQSLAVERLMTSLLPLLQEVRAALQAVVPVVQEVEVCLCTAPQAPEFHQSFAGDTGRAGGRGVYRVEFLCPQIVCDIFVRSLFSGCKDLHGYASGYAFARLYRARGFGE